MLEYIEVEKVMGFLSDKVKIWVKDGEVRYNIRGMRHRIFSENLIADISPESLFEKLEAINIPAWNKHYEPKGYVVLEGESWTVRYKREAEKVIRRTGENAWPKEWNKLLVLVKSVIGGLEVM